MMDSKKAYGMSIQMSNHPEYMNAVQKYSQVMKTDFLSVEMRVFSLANTIGRYASEDNSIDPNNIGFLTKSYILGKVDGGEPTINYINKKTIKEENKLSEYEIMMYRLNRIFEPGSITEDVLKELMNLYGNDKSLPHSYIVRLAYVLELVYCHLINEKGYDWIELKKDIIMLGKKIGEYYKDNKDFKITQDIQDLIIDTIKSIPELPQELQKDIEDVLDKYNRGELEKKAFIESISNLNLYEKKDKFVR